MSAELFKEIVRLDEEKAELEEQLNTVKERRREVETQILDYMAETGITNIRVDGRTIFTRSQVWVTAATSAEALANAMIGTELEDYVKTTVNTNSISALGREYIKEHDGGLFDADTLIGHFPEQVRQHLKATERHEVRTRKTS